MSSNLLSKRLPSHLSNVINRISLIVYGKHVWNVRGMIRCTEDSTFMRQAIDFTLCANPTHIIRLNGVPVLAAVM